MYVDLAGPLEAEPCGHQSQHRPALAMPRNMIGGTSIRSVSLLQVATGSDWLTVQVAREHVDSPGPAS